MRQRTPLLVRGLATGLMAIGLVGATALPVAAEEICQDQPVLAAVDGNGDGVASVGEIRSVAPDNAELQAAADQLEARGVTGIRYTGCDDSGGDGGTGTGDGGAGAGTGDGGTGTGDGGSGTGTGDGGAGTGDGGAVDGTASGDGAEASGSGSGTDSATTGDGSTGTSASSADRAETGDGTTGSADAVSISGLPSTGQGASASGWDATMVMLILSAASVTALGAAVTLRKRSLA
jgi:hypothetical protein